MLAIHLAHGHLTLQENYPQPLPQAGEALIRVVLAGICSTDLEIVKGYVPGFAGVLGHEFVGIVAQADSAPEWIGRRVVGSINMGCGTCPECTAHGPEHCPTRTVLGIHHKDGALAEYITLPLANLHEVPAEVPNTHAVFTEPLAAALRIREQIVVRPTARTAVIGPGRLGMLVGKVLSLAGTHVTMLGRSAASLELAAQWDLATGLVGDTADNSFDVVVEATGNPQGLANALRLTRPQGTIVLKSTFAGMATLDLTKVVVAELNLIGSRCGPFAPALRLLAQKSVPVDDLIEAQYPLHSALTALEVASQPGMRKILIACDSP